MLQQCVTAQEQEVMYEQMEAIDQGSSEAENDFTKTIGAVNKHSYTLNNITKENLEELGLLSPQQILSFFHYKQRNGVFISIFELQAIPYWDIVTIKKFSQVLKLNETPPLSNTISDPKEKGYQQISLRMGRSASSATSGEHYWNGIKQTVYYRNTTLRNISMGFSAEKDAGEKSVADFIGLFAQFSNLKYFKQLIVGDYLVKMGQGLIHWQGYAFGKSTNLLTLVRQGRQLQPHTGTEENRFQRGLAFIVERKSFSLTYFLSMKKIDANIVYDSSTNSKWVSSLLVSGLHRTQNEIVDKHTLQAIQSGFTFTHSFQKGHIGLNGLYTQFNTPIQKRNLPYNTYSINGKVWYNISSDFIFASKIGTFFGEAGIDKRLSRGLILGYLKSLNRTIDIGFQWRNISKSFNAISSNIIAHRSNANNEKGFYLGINIKINSKQHLESFIDQYVHPFPVFSVDGIQRGWDHTITYTHTFSKKAAVYIRWMKKTKNENSKATGEKLYQQLYTSSYHTRLHGTFRVNDAIECRVRNELLHKINELGQHQYGWLGYAEFILRPPLEPYSLSLRSTYYHTDGFESSIYAMERDLPHYYAMNAYYQRGVSTYLLIQYRLKNRMTISSKWIQEKKYFPSSRASSNFFTGISGAWRLQLTMKF